MKTKLIVLAVSLAFASSAFSLAQARAADSCNGCDELKMIEAKFMKLKEGDEEGALPLLRKGSSAVRRMGVKLNKAQIHAISALLAAAYPNDVDYAIIDNNFKIFKVNQKAFFEDFKTFPERAADNLKSELDIKLGEAAHGQDSDPKY